MTDPQQDVLSGRLDQKTALVTGGSRGIGAGSAAALARAGAHVILVGRDRSGLAAEAEAIRADGGRADTVEWDVGNGDSASELLAAAVAVTGSVQILVHAAGNQLRKPALDYEPEDWDAVLGLHLRAGFLLAQAFARHRTGHPAAPRPDGAATVDPQPGGGSIVFIGSLTSRRLGLPGIVAYSAAKSGVLGLSRTLAVEWGDIGIRVNAVLPGFVATELTKDVDGTPERDALTSRAPAGRLGTPADIGAAVAFLASPAADFITGETLTVDGGWSNT